MLANLKSRVLAAAVSLLALGLVGSPAQAQGKPPVKIGVATDLSGTWAPLGEQVVRAIKFAQQEATKAGGVDGRPLDIKIVDSEGKPDVARRQLEKLSLDGYKILTGIISSGETLAIAPLVERWEALFMATISKDDKVTGAECKRRMFRVNMNNSMDAAAIETWLHSRPEKKWAVIASDITFAHGSADLFTKIVKASGRQVVGEFYPANNTNDYAPFIEQIKSSGAEGVWVIISGRDGVTFAQQAKQFGLIGSKTIGGVSFIADKEAAQLGETVKGIYGIVNYSATLNTPENQKFVKDWQAVYPNSVPTNFEGETYMGMQVLFQAIKGAGSTDPKVLADWMPGKTFDTIKGKAVMRAADHQLISPNYFGAIALNGGIYRAVINTTIPVDKVAPPVTCKF